MGCYNIKSKRKKMDSMACDWRTLSRYKIDMSISIDFICQEIEKQVYDISLHADDERIAEGLTINWICDIKQ